MQRPSLRQQWASGPGSANTALALAQAQLAQDAAAAAIWALRAVACEPRWSEALVMLANIRINAGTIGLGKIVLHRAAALSPALWSAWRSLSAAEWQATSYGDALTYQRRCFMLRGSDSSLQMQLAILEALEGAPEKAVRQASIALEGDPSLVEAAVSAGAISLSRGKSAAAAMLFERVLDFNPEHSTAILGLQRARMAVAQSSQDMAQVRRFWGSTEKSRHHPKDELRQAASPGYLVIRGYNCGFWGEVLHVSINLALADIMGRTPVVFWGQEVRYRHPQLENAWELFFEPVSDVRIGDLAGLDASTFPRHWTPRTLTTAEHLRDLLPLLGNLSGVSAIVAVNRPEAIVVSDGYVDMNDAIPWSAPGHRWASSRALEVFREVFARRIRPRKAIQADLDRLASQLFGTRRHIAVHFRAPSLGKNHEALEKSGVSLPDYFVPLDRLLAENPEARVFLITDMDYAVDAFRQRYGDRVLSLDRIRLVAPPEQPDGSLPAGSDVGVDPSLDGYRLGLEVLIDAFLAAGCEWFVGDGASGVSAAVANLKNWPDDRIILLRRNVFVERFGMSSGPFGLPPSP